MSYASGRSRNVNRRERRQAKQADGEREGEEALAGEIHHCFRSVKLDGVPRNAEIRDSPRPVRETS
jgi:hypothetical protein